MKRANRNHALTPPAPWLLCVEDTIYFIFSSLVALLWLLWFLWPPYLFRSSVLRVQGVADEDEVMDDTDNNNIGGAPAGAGVGGPPSAAAGGDGGGRGGGGGARGRERGAPDPGT